MRWRYLLAAAVLLSVIDHPNYGLAFSREEFKDKSFYACMLHNEGNAEDTKKCSCYSIGVTGAFSDEEFALLNEKLFRLPSYRVTQVKRRCGLER
jgi:hypothetical protein